MHAVTEWAYELARVAPRYAWLNEQGREAIRVRLRRQVESVQQA